MLTDILSCKGKFVLVNCIANYFYVILLLLVHFTIFHEPRINNPRIRLTVSVKSLKSVFWSTGWLAGKGVQHSRMESAGLRCLLRFQYSFNARRTAVQSHRKVAHVEASTYKKKMNKTEWNENLKVDFLLILSLVVFSSQQIIDCSIAYGNLGCSGGSLKNTLQYIQRVGGIMQGIEYSYKARVSTSVFSHINVSFF